MQRLGGRWLSLQYSQPDLRTAPSRLHLGREAEGVRETGASRLAAEACEGLQRSRECRRVEWEGAPVGGTRAIENGSHVTVRCPGIWQRAEDRMPPGWRHRFGEP